MDLKRYKFKINHIVNELENLECGIFYEDGCISHPGTPSAKTIAKNLRHDFNELMDKITNLLTSWGWIFLKNRGPCIDTIKANPRASYFSITNV